MEKLETNVETAKSFRAVPLAFELGFTIALPIVLLALAGRLLDKHFTTSPIFLLVGILASIVITTVLVYKKVSKIL